jgi:hypothetical protein
MVEPVPEINGADLVNLLATDETSDHKWKILQIFNDVRQRLIEHGFKDLAASFPVQEMPRAEETSNFIGMTYFNLCAEVDAETTKGKKLYQTVDRVEVQLLDDNDKFLPIFRLLPTLLHEFAHVITEVHRAFGDKDMRRKKVKKFCKAHSDHDTVFYNHYRELLKASEDLGIYVLPPFKPNKFSEQRLRMLDNIDHSSADVYLCGTSKLFQEHDLTHFNTNELPPQLKENMKVESVIPGDEAKRQAPLTLSVTNNKGVKKAIVLKERTLACLLTEAGKKLNAKPKPKKANTTQGTEVNDEFLATLTAFDSGDLVIVCA